MRPSPSWASPTRPGLRRRLFAFGAPWAWPVCLRHRKVKKCDFIPGCEELVKEFHAEWKDKRPSSASLAGGPQAFLAAKEIT
ncbi:hypothetical protein PAAG_09022 [Paracoccidioides lutzii Pb01]|uniref:Uncharacterized protein n=1 Tax=Paracoccidioides lutzii (strain ATCC MYA-826 / Pb01) TaxID=502779 RepID=C1HE29_PARBA|nr:hypothetical protein PAAG_09022 [Paracoccidioides lutzii Pb01]EEH40569.2 hypothetical protein PAAG_09022 [Paracoccidioides lutzii Pb01]